MKRNFEKFRLIIQETEKMTKEFPGIRRFEAFKRAVAKIRFLEEQQYSNNGNTVPNLIGSHNSNDWTY